MLLDDVEENRDNIAVNSGNIAQNADHIQEGFKELMNFDAIRHIEHAYLESSLLPPILEGPLIVDINGNEGYTCDTDSTVDQHTADLLCQKAGYAGATSWFTQGERFKTNTMNFSINIVYITFIYNICVNIIMVDKCSVELELNFKHPIHLTTNH